MPARDSTKVFLPPLSARNRWGCVGVYNPETVRGSQDCGGSDGVLRIAVEDLQRETANSQRVAMSMKYICPSFLNSVGPLSPCLDTAVLVFLEACLQEH